MSIIKIEPKAPPTAIEVRTTRNEMLSQTDWTSGTDVTMSASMKVYRQALRDVPLQAGFPSTITWPQEP